jgi:predicted secreted protein
MKRTFLALGLLAASAAQAAVLFDVTLNGNPLEMFELEAEQSKQYAQEGTEVEVYLQEEKADAVVLKVTLNGVETTGELPYETEKQVVDENTNALVTFVVHKK